MTTKNKTFIFSPPIFKKLEEVTVKSTKEKGKILSISLIGGNNWYEVGFITEVNQGSKFYAETELAKI